MQRPPSRGCAAAGLNRDQFLMRIAELDMHPLDTAGPQGLRRTEVCAEGIHITDNALIPLKDGVVDRNDRLTWLGRTIRRRGVAPRAGTL